MTESKPDQDKIAQLQEALAQYAAGNINSDLFEEDLRQAAAPLHRKAINLLNSRRRSRWELKQRLSEVEDATPELIDWVLDQLEQSHLIDDAEFAAEWVRQRHQYRQKSTAILRRELAAKGIAEPLIIEALDQVSPDDEWDNMTAVIDKKARTLKTAPADRGEYEKALRKLVGVAVRRGYPSGEALSYSRQVLDNLVEGSE